MRRKFVAAALVGWSSFALLACTGDDSNAPLDAGLADATTLTDGADPKGDGGDGGGACVPYDASALSDAQVQLGRALVAEEKCQKCHGETMGGNKNGVQGPGGAEAYPPNLTNDPATGLGCWTDDEIANAILNGLDDQGGPLCPPMPVFSLDAGVDAAGAAAIVAYLRSLPAAVNQVPDTECSATEDAGGVDAGEDSSAPDAGADALVSDSGDAQTTLDAGTDATVPADAGEGGSVADAAADVASD
jgi:hypothetical protein